MILGIGVPPAVVCMSHSRSERRSASVFVLTLTSIEKMMNRRTFRTVTASLLAMVMITLAACDSGTAPEAEDDLAAEAAAALQTELTQELSLTSEQQGDVQDVMDRHEGQEHEPGFLWTLAAELQATLTDEQKQGFFDRTTKERGDLCTSGRFGDMGEGPGGFGLPRPGGFLGGHGYGFNGGGSCLDDVLTDEQKEAVDALRESFGAEFEALREQFRAGDLEQEAFREQLQALHDALAAEIDALLTDEQRDAIEACRAERQAEREAEREARRAADRAAMSAALGLTADEEAAVFALLDEHKTEVEALVGEFQDDLISCDVFQTTLSDLKAAQDESLQAILDDTQWEVVLIHRALSHRMRRHGQRRGGRFGGPGGTGG